MARFSIKNFLRTTIPIEASTFRFSLKIESVKRKEGVLWIDAIVSKLTYECSTALNLGTIIRKKVRAVLEAECPELASLDYQLNLSLDIKDDLFSWEIEPDIEDQLDIVQAILALCKKQGLTKSEAMTHLKYALKFGDDLW